MAHAAVESCFIVRKYIALFMKFLLGGCLGILHDVDWFKLHPLLIKM